MSPAKVPNAPAIRAALWMIGSILAFSAMAIAAKQIGPRHDSFEIMTVRSAVGFVLVLALAAASGKLHEITARNLGGHALRNIIHFTGISF